MPRSPMGDSVGYALVTFVGAAVLSTGFGVLGVVIVVMLLAARGEFSWSSLTEEVDVAVLLAILIPSQIGILAAALGAAYFTGCPFRHRVGLVRPAIGRLGIAVLLLGTGVPAAISLAAAWTTAPAGSLEPLLTMWETVDVGTAVVWVVAIGALPGIGEEILFRGMIQRGLMRRLRPWSAILVTSLLFGLLHVYPPQILLAFILGVWFGVVAWRTGSIIPGMLMHAGVNSLWNGGQIVVRQAYADATWLPTVFTVLGILSIVAFLVSIVLLVRVRRDPVLHDPPPEPRPVVVPVPAAAMVLGSPAWPPPPPLPLSDGRSPDL